MDQSSQHQLETQEQIVALEYALNGVSLDKLSPKGLVEYLKQILQVYLGWKPGFPPGFNPCSRRGPFGIHLHYGEGVSPDTKVMVLASMGDDTSLLGHHRGTLLATYEGTLLIESDFTTTEAGRQRRITRPTDQYLEDVLSLEVIEEVHAAMDKAIDNRVHSTLKAAGRVLGSLSLRSLPQRP